MLIFILSFGAGFSALEDTGNDRDVNANLSLYENETKDYILEKNSSENFGKTCPSYVEKVCGVDGKTYTNPCMAAGVKIAYTGVCKELLVNEVVNEDIDFKNEYYILLKKFDQLENKYNNLMKNPDKVRADIPQAGYSNEVVAECKSFAEKECIDTKYCRPIFKKSLFRDSYVSCQGMPTIKSDTDKKPIIEEFREEITKCNNLDKTSCEQSETCAPTFKKSFFRNSYVGCKALPNEKMGVPKEGAEVGVKEVATGIKMAKDMCIALNEVECAEADLCSKVMRGGFFGSKFVGCKMAPAEKLNNYVIENGTGELKKDESKCGYYNELQCNKVLECKSVYTKNLFKSKFVECKPVDDIKYEYITEKKSEKIAEVVAFEIYKE